MSVSSAEPVQSVSRGQTKSVCRNWFTIEIQQMMHGFGDCHKPLADSAVLIEDIVHQQMCHMLEQAEDVAKLRCARFLGLEDFLFLLRKDKVKLRRLVRHMELKDFKAATFKGVGAEEEDTSDSAAGDVKQALKKRRKICYDFLSSIDQTGEMVDLVSDEGVDDIKYERQQRAEQQTRGMDAHQYREYTEARQASFTPRYKTQKFKDWLLTGASLDIKPNPLAIEVLSYLALETVAQIVDVTLLMKRDLQVTAANPFSAAMPPVCMNTDACQLTVGTSTGSVGSITSPTMTNSPCPSPPSTPTTPVSLTSPINSSTGQTVAPSAVMSQNCTSLTKFKSKKKKKSQQLRDLHNTRAIQPHDIREAMRRYTQAVGPFADFSKAPMLAVRERLLCC